MIDIKELKRGDVVWVIKHATLWQSQYGDDCIEIPVGVDKKTVIRKEDYPTCTLVKMDDDSYVFDWCLFYTKEEAEKYIRKRRLEIWKEFKFDKVLKELEKLKKQIEEGE